MSARAGLSTIFPGHLLEDLWGKRRLSPNQESRHSPEVLCNRKHTHACMHIPLRPSHCPLQTQSFGCSWCHGCGRCRGIHGMGRRSRRCAGSSLHGNTHCPHLRLHAKALIIRKPHRGKDLLVKTQDAPPGLRLIHGHLPEASGIHRHVQ